MIRISCLQMDRDTDRTNHTSVKRNYSGNIRIRRGRGDALCQLVSESPVAAVVGHHELLQLVQILSPLVCVEKLKEETG